MQIPLAKRNVMLQAPRAQAGQAFDPSASIARMGDVAANSLKLAQGAVDDMGDAIVLRQRQNEDFVGKEATLKFEEALLKAQTDLQQQQGLAAEQWRNNEYKHAVEKAQLEFNNSINTLNHSDIKNQYVEGNIESLNSSNAHADNYAYKERLNAENAMSKDIVEYYKRNAKMNAANYYNPNKQLADAARASFAQNRAAIRAEVMKNAAQNGLTDPTYLRLKTQEADDEFFVEMADEISQLQGGLPKAQQFINENVGKVTTAAIDKAQKALEEDLLVDEIMKDPMRFINDKGGYNMDLAYNFAPNLNDRDRRRIVSASVSAAKSAMKNGGGLTETDLKMLNAWGVKVKSKDARLFERIGWVREETMQDAKYLKAKERDEYIKGIEEKQKAFTVGDTEYEFYNNFIKVAKSTTVIDKRTGEEVTLPENTLDAMNKLADYSKRPDIYLIQDNQELAGYNLAEEMSAFEDFLRKKKGYKDEPSRGIISPEKYSTLDRVVHSLRDSYGLDAGETAQVVFYMLDHINEIGVDTEGNKKFNEKGQPVFKYNMLRNFDLSKKGAYDELIKIGANERLRQIETLYNEAIMNTVGRGNRELGIASMPVDFTVTQGELYNYVNGRNAMSQEEYNILRKQRAYDVAGWLGK